VTRATHRIFQIIVSVHVNYSHPSELAGGREPREPVEGRSYDDTVRLLRPPSRRSKSFKNPAP